MSTPVVSFDRTAKAADAVQLIFLKNIESFIILDQNRVVGIMTFRDLVREILLEKKNPSELSVEQIMSRGSYNMSA